MVQAGWLIETGTTTPFKFEAKRQVVDFGRFLKVAPESEYNSALSNMTVSCAALAAGIMTFLF